MVEHRRDPVRPAALQLAAARGRRRLRQHRPGHDRQPHRRRAAGPPRPGPADHPRLLRGRDRRCSWWPRSPSPASFRPGCSSPSSTISSLTGPLSSSGLRSLFPLLVPEPLWERVNAVDSNGWVLATVVGAPFGAVFAQVLGFEPALGIIAAGYLAAALVMIGAPDPRTDVASTGNLAARRLARSGLHLAQQDAAGPGHLALDHEPVRRRHPDRRAAAGPEAPGHGPGHGRLHVRPERSLRRRLRLRLRPAPDRRSRAAG